MNNTIASLALLKVNWDNNPKPRDFLEIFVPFTATLMNRKNYEVVDVNTICRDFESEFGLLIPYHPMVAILSRAIKCGYVRKVRHTSYIPVKGKIEEADFTDIALEQERKYRKVLESFIEFCRTTYSQELSETEAKNVLVAFLKDYDLDVLFINEDLATLLPEANASTVQKHLINSFVRHASKSEPEIFTFIVDMSVGHIIANTIVYRDLGRYQGNLRCNLYLDIAFLFTIAGINGEERKQAYTEFLCSMSSAQSNIFVFRHTYDEFMGIIETCMDRVEKGSYDPTKANRASVFFAENGYSASDIERLLLSMPSKLQALRIQVVDTPAPLKDTQYQIDETKLTTIIVDIYKQNDPGFDETEKEHTIYRDVKSISAIYKLRKGHSPTLLRDLRHLFVTTNSTLARASRIFELKESQQEYFFFPATLTDVLLGTLIWIQSPKKVTEISQNRLMANCYAALQPNRALVKKLTDTADRLRSDGTLTEEDTVLLKQSRVARNLLQEETLGDPNRFTDKTAFDILDGVRAEVRKEERAKFECERESLRIEEQNLSVQSKQDRERAQLATEEQKRVQEQLEKAMAEKTLTDRHLALIAERIALGCQILFYGITIVIVVVAFAFQMFPDRFDKNETLRLWLSIVALLLSIASLVNGFNVKGTGQTLNDILKKQITHVLRGRS